MNKKEFNQKKTAGNGKGKFDNFKKKQFKKDLKHHSKEKKNEENESVVKEKKQEDVSFKKKRYTKEQFESLKEKYVNKFASMCNKTFDLSKMEVIETGVINLKSDFKCLPNALGKIPPMLRKGQNVLYSLCKSRNDIKSFMVFRSNDGRVAVTRI